MIPRVYFVQSRPRFSRPVSIYRLGIGVSVAHIHCEPFGSLGAAIPEFIFIPSVIINIPKKYYQFGCVGVMIVLQPIIIIPPIIVLLQPIQNTDVLFIITDKKVTMVSLNDEGMVRLGPYAIYSSRGAVHIGKQ